MMKAESCSLRKTVLLNQRGEKGKGNPGRIEDFRIRESLQRQKCAKEEPPTGGEVRAEFYYVCIC